MRRLLAACCLAVTPALAPALDAGDFAARIELRPSASSALQRIAVPDEIFALSRTPDLADVRVFNRRGEEVPFALYPPRPPAAPTERIGVAVVPIRADVYAAAQAGGRMEIRQVGNRTTVLIDGARLREKSTRVAAYVLDTRHIKAQVTALEVDAAFETGRLVPITISASRDLKTWRALASAEPLYRLPREGGVLERTGIKLPSPTSLEDQFVRVTWDHAMSFELRSATLETVVSPAAEPSVPMVKLGAPLAQRESEIEWAVPTIARISGLEVRPAETNRLVAVEVFGRSPEHQWRRIGRGVVYRLQHEGAEKVSPPLDIAAGSYTAIRLASAAGSAAFGTEPPSMALRFAPREVVFVASGEGPFVLAAGRANTAAAALPLATVVPGYKAGAEANVPLAQIVKQDTAAPRQPSALSRFGLDARTLTLWAVLIGAVLILSAYALTLLRKANAARATAQTSKDATET